MSTTPRKLYFNEYVAGYLKTRSDFEQINTDMLYFCLLMKMNFYAKEVYFQRKKNTPMEHINSLFNHLKIHRKFTLDCFEIPEPNWTLIQNELEDSLAYLDSLPLQDDNPSAPPTQLGSVAPSEQKPASLEVDSDLEGEVLPSLERTLSLGADPSLEYSDSDPEETPGHVHV